MGHCQYQFNPSELYQRTAPGQAPEVTCGALTWPAVDEPEVATIRVGMGSQGAIYEYRPTGNHVARVHDDPYCPAHGGSPEPPPPPVSAGELEQMRQSYLELVAQYQAQQALELEAAGQRQAEQVAGAVQTAQLLTGVDGISEEDVQAAAEHYLAAARDAEGGVTGGQ